MEFEKLLANGKISALCQTNTISCGLFFYFPLCVSLCMHDNEFETKENTI